MSDSVCHRDYKTFIHKRNLKMYILMRLNMTHLFNEEWGTASFASRLFCVDYFRPTNLLMVNCLWFYGAVFLLLLFVRFCSLSLSQRLDLIFACFPNFISRLPSHLSPVTRARLTSIEGSNLTVFLFIQFTCNSILKHSGWITLTWALHSNNWPEWWTYSSVHDSVLCVRKGDCVLWMNVSWA